MGSLMMRCSLQRIVTVHVTSSTGIACPPWNLTGALTVQEVTLVCVTHSLSPGQPPFGVVQGPAGIVVGKLPGAHTGGFVGHLMTHDPFGPVQVPVPEPVQQPTGLPLPMQKELGVHVPVPDPVQHGYGVLAPVQSVLSGPGQSVSWAVALQASGGL
jgi:hypothetical protein